MTIVLISNENSSPPSDPDGEFLPGYSAPGYYTGADNQKVIDLSGGGADAMAVGISTVEADAQYVQGDEVFIAIPMGNMNPLGVNKQAFSGSVPDRADITKGVVVHLVAPDFTGTVEEGERLTTIRPGGLETSGSRSNFAGIGSGQTEADFRELHVWNVACYLNARGAFFMGGAAEPSGQTNNPWMLFGIHGCAVLEETSVDAALQTWGLHTRDVTVIVEDCVFDHPNSKEHSIYTHRSPNYLTFGPNVIKNTYFIGCGGQALQTADRDYDEPDGLGNGFEGVSWGRHDFVLKDVFIREFALNSGRGNVALKFSNTGGTFDIQDVLILAERNEWLDSSAPHNVGAIQFDVAIRCDQPFFPNNITKVDAYPKQAGRHFLQATIRRLYAYCRQPAEWGGGLSTRELVNCNSFLDQVDIQDSIIMTDDFNKSIDFVDGEDAHNVPYSSQGPQGITRLIWQNNNGATQIAAARAASSTG